MAASSPCRSNNSASSCKADPSGYTALGKPKLGSQFRIRACLRVWLPFPYRSCGLCLDADFTLSSLRQTEFGNQFDLRFMKSTDYIGPIWTETELSGQLLILCMRLSRLQMWSVHGGEEKNTGPYGEPNLSRPALSHSLYWLTYADTQFLGHKQLPMMWTGFAERGLGTVLPCFTLPQVKLSLQSEQYSSLVSSSVRRHVVRIFAV
jgi:hypothetical protein